MNVSKKMSEIFTESDVNGFHTALQDIHFPSGVIQKGQKVDLSSLQLDSRFKDNETMHGHMVNGILHVAAFSR